MENIQIHRVSLHDIHQLQKIGRETFAETFSEENTEENMTQYLLEKFSIENLTAELENKNSEFYFASLENTIIAYLKLNFRSAQTELKENNALEIERIYVLKSFHGKNVGQLLLQTAKNSARQKGLNFIWLGVWEKNLRAIHFYKKNGFAEFDTHIFKLGEDEQTDIMMKLQLT